MYVPKHFQENDWSEIRKVIDENSLATVISCDGALPVATHVPLRLVEASVGKFKLQGHMARSNSHWRQLEQEKKTLAIFTGADSYISPRWYESTNVPTWNYLAVHVYGKPRLVTDGNELQQLLKGLVDRYEGHVPEAERYMIEALPADYLGSQMRAIVGFEISVDEVQVSFKLSQNRNERDHENVMLELRKGDDPAAHGIACAMASQRKREKIHG